MNYLTLTDIRRVAGEAKPQVTLPTTSAWLEQISCQICYCCKHNGMVTHRDCMRLFCAQCILSLYNRNPNSNCALCRQPTDLSQFTTRFCNPPPNDNWMIDNLVYKCKDCGSEMNFTSARTHPSSCHLRPNTFQPPSFIFDWNDVDVVRRETVSNPIVGELERRRDRLLIYHHNGIQVDSKFVKQTWDIPRVKTQIARITDTDATNIRLFHFSHKELHNDMIVKEFATLKGATHITSLIGFPHQDELSTRTALISLHNAGPPPVVSRPDNARGRANV